MRTQPQPLFLALLAVLLLLPSCGGGGGDGDDQIEPQTVMLNAVRARCGYVNSNGFVAEDDDCFVGTIPDVNGFVEQRGILVFGLSSIPAGASIVSAEIAIAQGGISGTPYTQVVQIIVDHINGFDAAIEPTDFDSTGLSFLVNPPLSADAVLEVKTLDVSAQVANDLANSRSESTYRLRGQAINPLTAGNNDLVDPVDLARFDTNAGQAILTVVFTAPAETP